MFEHFSLADVKAAPLSIMVYLSMNGNRAVSVSDLAAETGFTEKPIRKGLATLQELGVVVSPRKNRYQLTGREYQLPLSWGEQVLPSGDSPVISGYIPGKAGNSPELERRVSLLEKAVFGYQDQVPGDSPEMQGDYPLWDSETDEDPEVEVLPREEWAGNIPGKLGVYPYSKEQRQVVSGQWSGKVPEKQGENPERVEEKSSTHFEKESETGDIPEEAGIIPEKQGENPEVLINNNTNNPEKEVSKYVGRSTYLPDNKSKEGTELTGAGEIPEEAVNRWMAAKEQLKGLMDRGMYATVLKKAELIGYEAGHYTVAVENAFTKDWADTRLLIQAEKILAMLEGGEVSVSFVVDQSTQITAASEEADQYPAPSLELLPMPEDPKAAELTEICNDYLLDPAGIEYSKEQLHELICMEPDPVVLRFALPRLSGFNAVKAWCELSKTSPSKLKRWLLTYYKIAGKAVDRLEKDERVSFGLITSVCADQGIEPEGATNQMRGKAIWLIEQFAKSAGPA